jgi:hypothetical protein
LNGFLNRLKIKSMVLLKALVFAANDRHFDVVADALVINPSLVAIDIVQTASATHECRCGRIDESVSNHPKQGYRDESHQQSENPFDNAVK